MDPRASHTTLGDESGFGLIEVLVSALLIVIISLAALGGLDAASKASGRSKARAIGSALAQQDQERIQGYSAEVLRAYSPAPREVDVDGVTYTVRSEGRYVADADQGAPNCNNPNADYVRLTTWVSWEQMNGVQPIRLVSVVRPPAGTFNATHGAIVMMVTKADGTGVNGLTVNLTDGPAAAMSTVTVNGCAYFGFVPQGSWKLRYSLAGWVDRGGSQDVVKDVSAIGDLVTSYSGEYDREGTIVADVETRARWHTTSATVRTWTSKASTLRLTQAGIPGSGERLFTAPAAIQRTAGDLFPFPSAYGIHTGGCAGNALNAALTTSATGTGYRTSQVVAPGASYGPAPALKVFQPALDVRVRYDAVGRNLARVYFYPVTCPGARIGPIVTASNTQPQAGYLPAAELGLPFGTYNVCADTTIAGGTIRRLQLSNVLNDDYSGRRVAVDITSSGGPSATGACPA